MPRGFVGNSVKKFFENTEAALDRAGDAHNANPFEGRRSGVVPLPVLPATNNQTAPFSPEDAWSGGPHARNVGNSSNVVVDPDVYRHTLQRMDMVDYQAGADMYMISTEIEDMCSTIFVVPETGPRIAAIADQLKRSLGPLRSLTEEVAIDVRQFANEISNADHGNSQEVAISQAGSDQAIQRVSSSIDRQISSMERTSNIYQTRSQSLASQAQRERERADILANRF